MRLNDLVAVVTAGLRAAGEPAAPAIVAEMVYATGVLEVLPAVQALLRAMLAGGRPEGEAGAERDQTGTRSVTSPGSPPAP